jgi:hypothetical protein
VPTFAPLQGKKLFLLFGDEQDFGDLSGSPTAAEQNDGVDAIRLVLLFERFVKLCPLLDFLSR